NLMEQNPEYLAVRYVTFNGSVWSEVSNYDAVIPRADARVQLGLFSGDEGLLRTLALAHGELDASDVTLMLEPATPEPERPVRLIRFSAPVATDPNLRTNIAGVLQIDVRADAILDDIRAVAEVQAAAQSRRRILVADHLGNILYDSTNSTADTLQALARESAAQLGDASVRLQPDAPALSGETEGDSLISTSRLTFGTND